MKNILYILILLVLCCCSSNDSKTEKRQSKRDNTIFVKDKVKPIVVEDVLIGSIARLAILNDYLLIKNVKSLDKLVSIFDKNNFNYITSTADLGPGPGEITNMGYLETREEERAFYLSDHGKLIIYRFDIDSVIKDSDYVPSEKMKIRKSVFPSTYFSINDSLAIGLIIKPIGNSDFSQSVGTWNMNTGKIEAMPYEHPEIGKKRVTLGVSLENNIYIECYLYYDLMTICSLDGDLKYNIYGPNWAKTQKRRIDHYKKPIICKDKIFTAYSGEEPSPSNPNSFPTKFFVFDLNGDYIQTLDVEYQISDYCYDDENNRIIMVLDDKILQFGYLDLDGIID